MDEVGKLSADCRKLTEVMSPCAACRLLRRRCSKECNFAPYFPRDDPQKFATVHRIFGASNVQKMLQDIPINQRSDAVSSMVYEAYARIRDPVYGCVGAICSLQKEMLELQSQLALAQAEITRLRIMQQDAHDDFITDLTANIMQYPSPDAYDDSIIDLTAHNMECPSPVAYHGQQMRSSMFLDTKEAFNFMD